MNCYYQQRVDKQKGCICNTCLTNDFNPGNARLGELYYSGMLISVKHRPNTDVSCRLIHDIFVKISR